MANNKFIKLKYSAEHLDALYAASRQKGQVTKTGITYFFLCGNSIHSRKVVLFLQDGQLESALVASEKEVKALDSEIEQVFCVKYQESLSVKKNVHRKYTVYPGSLH